MLCYFRGMRGQTIHLGNVEVVAYGLYGPHRRLTRPRGRSDWPLKVRGYQSVLKKWSLGLKSFVDRLLSFFIQQLREKW